MKRRKFLKNSGWGSAGLLAAPALAGCESGGSALASPEEVSQTNDEEEAREAKESNK